MDKTTKRATTKGTIELTPRRFEKLSNLLVSFEIFCRIVFRND